MAVSTPDINYNYQVDLNSRKLAYDDYLYSSWKSRYFNPTKLYNKIYKMKDP